MKPFLRFSFVLLLIATPILFNFSPVHAQSGANRPANQDPVSSQSTNGTQVTIPADTTLRLVLVSQVNTKVSQVDDPVVAQLEEPFRVNGKLVFARGTEFRGRIAKLTQAKVGQRQASLLIVFDQVVTDYGTESVPTVVTSIEDYYAEQRLKADKDGTVQGGHSGSRTVNNTIKGGILGSIGGTGVLWGGGGGGAAAGTLGGAAGAGVLLTKGNDIHLRNGVIIRLKFTQPTTFSL
ncbi:MAG: hypothetical protein K1Y36_10885 [Blastocatellia bacterium]|nr:hypothetical protein [Blastocatellia bacterium]